MICFCLYVQCCALGGLGHFASSTMGLGRDARRVTETSKLL